MLWQNLPDALRANASNSAGVMARTCGDYTTAARLHRAAWCWGVVERLAREMGTQLSPAQRALRE